MKSFVSKMLSVALLISAVPGFAMQAPQASFTERVKTTAKNAFNTVKTTTKNTAEKAKARLVAAKDTTVEYLKPIQKLADEAAKTARLAQLDNDRATLKAAATAKDAKFADKVAYAKNTVTYNWEKLKAKNATAANATKYSLMVATAAAAAGLVGLTAYAIKKAVDAYKAKSKSEDSEVYDKSEKQVVKSGFNTLTTKAQELMKQQYPVEKLWNTAINLENNMKQLNPSAKEALFNAVVDFDNADNAQERNRAYANLAELVTVCNAIA